MVTRIRSNDSHGTNKSRKIWTNAIVGEWNRFFFQTSNGVWTPWRLIWSRFCCNSHCKDQTNQSRDEPIVAPHNVKVDETMIGTYIMINTNNEKGEYENKVKVKNKMGTMCNFFSDQGTSDRSYCRNFKRSLFDWKFKVLMPFLRVKKSRRETSPLHRPSFP